MAQRIPNGAVAVAGLLPNRACRNCSHIKAKCLPQPGTLVCQRCHRLGKDCTTTTSKKGQRSRPGPSLTPVSIQEPQGYVSTDTQLIPSTSRSQDAVTIRDADTNHPVIVWSSAPTISGYTTRSAINLFNISPEIGHSFVEQLHETLFDYFRLHMSKHFPFIVFPTERSPAEIASERPFLYSCCIMTANHRDPPTQTRISRDIIKYISERILLSGEKSLDLLQGLAVITAWYHVYTHVQPQLMNLLHLSKALLVDLGLNRAFDLSMPSLKGANDPACEVGGSRISSGVHTAEQRRIGLAIYHAHTSFAYAFGRLDPTPWTDYLEESVKELEKHPEFESDNLMTATIRLDRIHEKYASDAETRMGKTIPTMSYVKLFSNDLISLRVSLSDQLKNDHSFLAQILSVEISLLEKAFMQTNGQTLKKIEAMHICLQKIYDFLREFNAQPDSDYTSIPFLTWVQVAHVLDVLAKLSFARLDGWDLEFVRNSPGFLSVIDDLKVMMIRLQEHETIHFPDSRDARFKMFARRLDKFKQWYDKNLEIQRHAGLQNSDTGPEETNMSDTQTGFGEFVDFSWQDFMTLPNLDSEFNFFT